MRIPGAPPIPPSAQAVSALAPLAKGQVAAFVARTTDLPVLTFVDAQGQPKSLADWKGKVVLLNLWATWCAPCRKEMPMLDALQRSKGGKDFEVVAVSMDRGAIDKSKAFFEEIKISALALYHDPSAKMSNTLNVIGLPGTLLIGRDGKELGRLVGPAEWDSPEAVALIEAALKL